MYSFLVSAEVTIRFAPVIMMHCLFLLTLIVMITMSYAHTITVHISSLDGKISQADCETEIIPMHSMIQEMKFLHNNILLYYTQISS